MRLTPEEARGFREDGLDPRLAGRHRSTPPPPPLTMQEFVDFLQKLQGLFGVFLVSSRPTPTDRNRL